MVEEGGRDRGGWRRCEGGRDGVREGESNGQGKENTKHCAANKNKH